jgi:hypothetical protein
VSKRTVENHYQIVCIRRSISTIAQPHSAQALTPDLLDMIDRLNKMRYKLLWIFRSREVTQAWHSLVHSPRYLVCSLLRHLWCIRPVVLTREHIYWASLRVDRCYTRATVPTTEVEVKISMEDTEQY